MTVAIIETLLIAVTLSVSKTTRMFCTMLVILTTDTYSIGEYVVSLEYIPRDNKSVQSQVQPCSLQQH